MGLGVTVGGGAADFIAQDRYRGWPTDDASIKQIIYDMLKDVRVTNLYVYRDTNNYPDGCELTLTPLNEFVEMKINITGEAFKQLQTIILATMGFEDADEIK